MVQEIIFIEGSQHEGYIPATIDEFRKSRKKIIEHYDQKLRMIETLRKQNNGIKEIDEVSYTNIVDLMKKRRNNAVIDLLMSEIYKEDELVLAKDRRGQFYIYIEGKDAVEKFREWEREMSIIYQ